MTRRLLTAASVLSLLLGTAGVTFWIVSESRTEWVAAVVDGRNVTLGVDRGTLAIAVYRRSTGPLLRWGSHPPTARTWLAEMGWSRSGFSASRSPAERMVCAPLWFAVLCSLALACAFALAGRRRPAPGHCSVCGYDLRASTGRCPECGTTIASSTGTPS